MSEMKKLKDQAERQEAVDRMSKVLDYVSGLADLEEEASYWDDRGLKLELYTMLGHLLVVFVSAFAGFDDAIRDMVVDISFIVFLVAAVRSWILHAKWRYAMGKFMGAMEVVYMIQGIDRPGGGNEKKKVEVKKRKPFFKEFLERIADWRKKTGLAPA